MQEAYGNTRSSQGSTCTRESITEVTDSERNTTCMHDCSCACEVCRAYITRKRKGPAGLHTLKIEGVAGAAAHVLIKCSVLKNKLPSA